MYTWSTDRDRGDGGCSGGGCDDDGGGCLNENVCMTEYIFHTNADLVLVVFTTAIVLSLCRYNLWHLYCRLTRQNNGGRCLRVMQNTSQAGSQAA